MKKAKPWGRKYIKEQRDAIENSYFATDDYAYRTRRWLATIDRYTQLIDKIYAACQLPDTCRHNAEPDFCDGCAYRRDNKLAAAWQNTWKILGRTSSGQLTRHDTRAENKNKVQKV